MKCVESPAADKSHISLVLSDVSCDLWSEDGTSSESFPHGLVYRPTWNVRGDLRFLSLRKWLIRYKHDQAKEFRRAKTEGDETPVNLAVGDCIDALGMFGNLKGFSVVPAPVGRSGAEHHFASKVAKQLAQELGLEYAPVLTGAAKRTKGVVSERDAKLDVSGSRVPDRVILFDDVATTGTTLQGCVNALRGAFVIPMAWIYQESQPLWDGDPLFGGQE